MLSSARSHSAAILIPPLAGGLSTNGHELPAKSSFRQLGQISNEKRARIHAFVCSHPDYPLRICPSTISAELARQIRVGGAMPIPIDRREFLKLGVLAASAQLAPLRSWSFTPQALPQTASPKKVLVLGAGLAGLVAAYELTQ